MKLPSVGIALIMSALAAFVVTVKAMPPTPVTAVEGDVTVVQAQRGSSYRDSDRSDRVREHRRERRVADCHRDVRTHRINGEMVTHRHVGSDCRIRIVNRSSQPVPGR